MGPAALALALVWLAGVEPAPVETDATPPVPEARPADAPTPAPPAAHEPEEATTVSPFDGLPVAPPPPRVDRTGLFDPWSVPIQSVVPQARPPSAAVEHDQPLLDPWQSRGSLRIAVHVEPDLRHPFTTASRSVAPRMPAITAGSAAPQVARADLRDPFRRAAEVAPPAAAAPSPAPATPIATPPSAVAAPAPRATPDLRDPFGHAPRLPPDPTATVPAGRDRGENSSSAAPQT